MTAAVKVTGSAACALTVRGNTLLSLFYGPLSVVHIRERFAEAEGKGRRRAMKWEGAQRVGSRTPWVEKLLLVEATSRSSARLSIEKV